MFLPCLPCCGDDCPDDGKPRTNPAAEGTWQPSGSWDTSVSWSFAPNTTGSGGETWFFYGSSATSKKGGGASISEIRDWYNLCNWYSNKTTAPDDVSNLPSDLNKRATTLPPSNAIIHVYGFGGIVTTSGSSPTVQYGYFWQGQVLVGSELSASGVAHDSSHGFIVKSGVSGTLNNGVKFIANGNNNGTVNGGAVFLGTSTNSISKTVNGGASFYDTSDNQGIVNGGAAFYDNSVNGPLGTVNSGAIFNDAACSQRTTGSFFTSPCTRKFVAHPTDLPTCNGTAPGGCDSASDTCGCG